MKYVDIKEEKKVNVVKDVQSKAHVNSGKVAYHLIRISEKGFERFKEEYVANKISHPLLMQHEIFGY